MTISRPTPSMAVALLALFVALGGTSYATVRAAVPAKSVGTPELKDDSVTRAKIAHHSITSVLIKPGSLMAADFAPGQIPSGPQGATGPAGAAGPAGPKGDKGDTGGTGAIARVKVRSDDVKVSPHDVGVVTASCHSDERASGAGTSWSDSGENLSTVSLTPNDDSSGVTSYVGRGWNQDTTSHWFTVYVLCYPS